MLNTFKQLNLNQPQLKLLKKIYIIKNKKQLKPALLISLLDKEKKR